MHMLFLKELLLLQICYITATNNDAYVKILGFKNNAPFDSCISKINNTLIDNAEDLDIVMSM